MIKLLSQDWLQESILSYFDFFIFLIFAFKLGHFKVQTIFSYVTNIQLNNKNRKTKKKMKFVWIDFRLPRIRSSRTWRLIFGLPSLRLLRRTSYIQYLKFKLYKPVSLIHYIFNSLSFYVKVLESILPNFDFFVFTIFASKLGHFKVQTILSYSTNTQA